MNGFSAFASDQTPADHRDVGALLSEERDVVLVSEQMDAAAASRLLRDRNARFLVVMDRPLRHMIGVLWPRDIVIAVVAREADPRSLLVGDMMTRLDVPLPVEGVLRQG